MDNEIHPTTLLRPLGLSVIPRHTNEYSCLRNSHFKNGHIIFRSLLPPTDKFSVFFFYHIGVKKVVSVEEIKDN